MTLRIRWALFAYDFGQFFTDKLPRAIAWRLPRSVAYWAAIRVIVHASSGKYGHVHPMGVSVEDILKRWGYEK